MVQNPWFIAVAAVIVVLALFRKGYIKMPGKLAGSSTTEDLGRRFFKAIQEEAQDDLAAFVAGKMKEEVKAKLQTPFSTPAPSEPA